jgi:transcriptional regulator with GAF, ATPase, and Fis domain
VQNRPTSEPTDPADSVAPLRTARRNAAASFEREYVRTLLEKNDGNITRAAAMAGVSRQMIQKLARKYGL